MRRPPRASILPLLLFGGCSGPQSALDPQGPQAGSLAFLSWLLFGVGTCVWILVLIALGWALLRRGADQAGATPEPGPERSLTVVVAACVALTVTIITGLTVASFWTTRRLHEAPGEPLVVRLRAYQWWWEVTYADPAPDRWVVSANEIRVPVGRPVRVELASGDVIHSFWVPKLAGKQDVIPGRDNAIAFTADRPGTFRGQCAEFCGLQHARMAFVVVALEPAAFEAWRERQLAEAARPADPEQELGRQVATGKACAACHAIRGTPAAGRLGPDLTHVASRETIAAGVLPTTRGSLAAWIADPQTIKPGSKMPAVPLSPEELRAVSAYLAALK